MGCMESKVTTATQTYNTPKIDNITQTASKLPEKENKDPKVHVETSETSSQTQDKKFRTTATQSDKIKFDDKSTQVAIQISAIPTDRPITASSVPQDFHPPKSAHVQEPNRPPQKPKAEEKSTENGTIQDAINMDVKMNIKLDEEAIASAKTSTKHIIASSTESQTSEPPIVTPMKKSTPGMNQPAPGVPVAEPVEMTYEEEEDKQSSEGTPDGSRDEKMADGKETQIEASEEKEKDVPKSPPHTDKKKVSNDEPIKDNDKSIVPLTEDYLPLVALATNPVSDPEAQDVKKEKNKEDPPGVPPPTALSLFLQQVYVSKVSQLSKTKEDVPLTQLEVPHLTGEESVQQESLDSTSRVTKKQPDVPVIPVVKPVTPAVEEQNDDIEGELAALATPTAVSGDMTNEEKKESTPRYGNIKTEADFTEKRLEEKTVQQRSSDLVPHLGSSEEPASTSRNENVEQQSTPKAKKKKSVWKNVKKQMSKAVRRLKK